MSSGIYGQWAGLAAPLDALAAFVAATTVGLPVSAILVVNN